MNWTLIPVCSNRLPSFGRIVTAPLTDSPSIYKGAFSLLFLSSLTSTVCLSSVSSRTMSMSTGVEKKNEDMLRKGARARGWSQRCRAQCFCLSKRGSITSSISPLQCVISVDIQSLVHGAVQSTLCVPRIEAQGQLPRHAYISNHVFRLEYLQIYRFTPPSYHQL